MPIVSDAWNSLPITEWVQNWASGTWPNYGLELWTDEAKTFGVRAMDGAGEGPYVEVRYESPPVYENISAIAYNRQVVGTWTPPALADRQTVSLLHSGTGAVIVSQQVGVSVGAFTFTDDGDGVPYRIVNGTSYKVKVSATNQYGPTSLTSPAVTPKSDYEPTVPLTRGGLRGGTNPAEKNVACGQREGGDPVNAATGVFHHAFQDLVIPGRGVPLAMSHSYSSDPEGLVDGPLGYGWSYPYGMSIRFMTTPEGAEAVVRQENGAEAVFTGTGPTYPPKAVRTDATLVRNADSTCTFTRRRREIFVFDSAGQLVRQKDLNG